jgi:P27 family predicted phage terminase small subunit
MAKTGRTPKPRHLKVLEGNPGGRALGPELKPPPSKPRCPSWLQDYAKTTWRRLTDILDGYGILTTADREMMAAYCEAVADYRTATETLAKTGLLVQGQKGNAVTNPLWRIKRDAARQIAEGSARFGLTPADRVRLMGEPDGSSSHGDDLEHLLGA